MLRILLLAVVVLSSSQRDVVAQQCVGDCDADGRVTVNELILGVNLALSASPDLARCRAFDDGGGRVTIQLLVAAVANALDGCASADPCADLPYVESFDAPTDGAPWPAPWVAIGDSVDVAEIRGGRTRLRPLADPTYSLARMYADVRTLDVEVVFRVRFEDLSTQGVGFYVRQNGGYLTDTNPPGEGYSVFIEGFRGFDGIGVWLERDGEEIPIEIDRSLSLQSDTDYLVRFRVTQANPTATRLQARIWPDGALEPLTWNLDELDQTPSLQNTPGGLAIDSWSNRRTPSTIEAHTLVDAIEVRCLSPLDPLSPRS